MWRVCGVGAPLLDHLVRLAAESEDRGWLVAYSGTVPNWFERYAGEEAEASEIWEYAAEFIPGLLQTADYCGAVRAVNSTAITKDDLDRSVALRQARQELLERDKPPRLHVVLNEAVPRRLVGGQRVMREQLSHLERMAKRSNITVQVMNPANERRCGTMIPDPSTLRWRKSSRSSGQNGACVELANVGAVRDSKNPTGPVLRVDLGTFLAAARAGRYTR